MLPLPLPREGRGHYDFGDIDWDEFWRVLEGDGPCNRQRLQHHVRVFEKGQWVRDALQAYRTKHAAKAA